MKKNSCTPINPKKYSCYGLKKIHTRNLITKKNSCGSKIPIPPPPITFLLGSLLLNNTLMPQVPTFVNVQVATSLISHILLHRKETKKKTLIQCRLIYFIKATEKIQFNQSKNLCGPQHVELVKVARTYLYALWLSVCLRVSK